MPNFFSTTAYTVYEIIMTPHDNINDRYMLKLCFNDKDNAIKNIIEGITIRQIELDSSITFCVLCVSLYNHTIANIDVIGIDTSIAPTKGNFLLTTDTIEITNAEIMVLIINCISSSFNLFYKLTYCII